jgi:hypothetical protein
VTVGANKKMASLRGTQNELEPCALRWPKSERCTTKMPPKHKFP